MRPTDEWDNLILCQQGHKWVAYTYNPIRREVKIGKMQDVHRANMVSIGAVGGSITAA